MTVEERIRKIIVDELGVEPSEVTANANLELDLGADSLDIVELTMCIEEEFEIEISDEAMDSIRTFGDAVKLVDGRLAPQPATNI